ncbi:MAG: alpha/beta fold hydrolase [Steroidobacteraceae bacterium]
MPKHSNESAAAPRAVRMRRAYFDCAFGQLHVRTAFPATGGFDEQMTLFCLHSQEGSSRSFDRFLAQIADVRSVYAPDLPGCGESDPPPSPTAGCAARAVAELALDLRLRQIDLLGVRSGGTTALELAASRPDLVRRVVLVNMPVMDPSPKVKQETLVLRTDHAADPFEAAPKELAKQIGAFLDR